MPYCYTGADKVKEVPELLKITYLYIYIYILQQLTDTYKQLKVPFCFIVELLINDWKTNFQL